MTDGESPAKDSEQDCGQSGDPGTTIAGDENLQLNLLQILLEQKVLSSAQAQLLLADQEVTGMTLDEVLIARGWVTVEQLDEIAPWRKQPENSAGTLRVKASSKNYQQNFKQYRALMERILGISWD